MQVVTSEAMPEDEILIVPILMPRDGETSAGFRARALALSGLIVELRRNPVISLPKPVRVAFPDGR